MNTNTTKYQIATIEHDRCNSELQIATQDSDYERKVLLIQKAFREIAKLCFEHDYELSDEDWHVLDEARLDDPQLSYDEVHARLAGLYRRIKRACAEKGASYAQREAQAVQ